jgi:hypothetical protein
VANSKGPNREVFARASRVVEGGASARHYARPLPPLSSSTAFEPLELKEHQQLLSMRDEIFSRFASEPSLSTLLLINPALAFEEVGVVLSAALKHHVLDAIRLPPAMKQRRAELVRRLTEQLGEAPKPNDARWLAGTLFERLKLQPKDTTGQEPVFKSPLAEGTVERLQKLRPALGRAKPSARAPHGTRLRLQPWRPAWRRLDLNGAVPALGPASTRPEEVPLEALYFYKEETSIARDLLELALIDRRAFPIQSGDSYRRIKAGEKPNAFRSWITAVKFPSGGGSSESGR